MQGAFHAGPHVKAYFKMTRPLIGIVDYKMGNLVSVEEGLSHLGLFSTRVSTTYSAANVDALILPGVGSFPKAIERLQESGLFEFIKSWATEGRKLVGICLGMQLLFQRGEEDGLTEGLGILHGNVVSLRATIRPQNAKIPNMGWRELSVDGCRPESQLDPVEQKIRGLVRRHPWMYFAHSYGVRQDFNQSPLACIDVGGHKFVGVETNGATRAFQGHPELSGLPGLELLHLALS